MASNIIIIVGGAVVVVKVEHCYYYMIIFLIVVIIITFINAIVTFSAYTETAIFSMLQSFGTPLLGLPKFIHYYC